MYIIVLRYRTASIFCFWQGGIKESPRCNICKNLLFSLCYCVTSNFLPGNVNTRPISHFCVSV